MFPYPETTMEADLKIQIKQAAENNDDRTIALCEEALAVELINQYDGPITQNRKGKRDEAADLAQKALVYWERFPQKHKYARVRRVALHRLLGDLGVSPEINYIAAAEQQSRMIEQARDYRLAAYWAYQKGETLLAKECAERALKKLKTCKKSTARSVVCCEADFLADLVKTAHKEDPVVWNNLLTSTEAFLGAVCLKEGVC